MQDGSNNEDIELQDTTGAAPSASSDVAPHQPKDAATPPSSSTHDAAVASTSNTSHPPVPNSPGPSTRAPSLAAHHRRSSSQPSLIVSGVVASSPNSRSPSQTAAAAAASASHEVDQPPPSATSAITPALQVRLSVFARLRRGILQLRGRTKLSLLLGAIMALGQVAAFSAVLGVTANEQCDRPLRTYLILYIIKTGLSWPISFYNTLAPRRCVLTDMLL